MRYEFLGLIHGGAYFRDFTVDYVGEAGYQLKELVRFFEHPTVHCTTIALS